MRPAIQFTGWFAALLFVAAAGPYGNNFAVLATSVAIAGLLALSVIEFRETGK